jgi:peptidoglycan/LPS O-acetylase OafA/YrhL
MDGARDKLLGLQLARGVAALLVALYHAGRMVALPQYAGVNPLDGFFGFGHAGVDFFFVLSGFIICTVHGGDLGRPERLARYAGRRVTRIYPIYWCVTAIALALLLLHPGGLASLSPARLANSLLLLPSEQEPLLGVAWTLQHEVVFYLVFGIAIASRRWGVAMVGVWLALIAYGLFDMPNVDWLRFLASPYHLQFAMGALTAWLVSARRVPHPLGLVGAGIAAFLACGLVENAGSIVWAGLASQLGFGAAATLVILGLAAAEYQGSLRIGRIGAFAGAASYSLYLIHTIVIGLAARLLASLGIVTLIPAWAVMLFTVAAALVAAGLLHWLIERRLISACRSLLRAGPARVTPAAAIGEALTLR